MSEQGYRKKLIEVAPFLPLDAISVASKADKDKKTGTIKNVHKWFAPMPTPAVRALIFSAVVDAPTGEADRERLLDLVKRLVPSNGNPPDARTLADARDEIRRSTGGELPTVFDPFCGGGSTLIEAQRLGLPAKGSDLNPVPVLITRTLTELIPEVAGRPPLASETGQFDAVSVEPVSGLLADVEHYATTVRNRVWNRVGHLYPAGPSGDTVLAWLWARTTTCPNPACGATMPLVTSMWLSKRRADSRALVARAVGDGVAFDISERPVPPTGTVSRSGAKCLNCGITTPLAQVREQARKEGLGRQLLCGVADGPEGRVYLPSGSLPLPPDPATSVDLDIDLPERALGFRVQGYGIDTHRELYTSRQAETLQAFAEAIADVPDQVRSDGGDRAWATSITSILGLALGKLAQSNSTQVRWNVRSTGSSKAEPAFGRHALPMVWDYAETNPFGGSVGDWLGQVDSISRGLRSLPSGAKPARVWRADARTASEACADPVLVITDPPYFDQIGYADLSDYFYVWHRKALRQVHEDLYTTIVTPKDPELIATPYRHENDKEAAAAHFVTGFTDTFRSLANASLADHPILIVYAHRQEESNSLGAASTGWDAMLEAVLAADLMIVGTLPVHGSYKAKLIGIGTNSLASYVVMVCRPRSDDLTPGSISDFRAALRSRLPSPVDRLLKSGESMVDVRQAAIGPGMEVYSQFSEVFDGTEPIPVRRALSIINEELGRILDEQLGEVDDETRWACQWYVDHGYEGGEYDEGRKLAQAYGLGVDGLAAAGIVVQGQGRIRLLMRNELPADWMGDDRVPAWEACQHLVKRLIEGSSAGEQPAAELLRALGGQASGVRELAQFLTNQAIEKGWSEEAVAYDSLTKSWPRIEQLASDRSSAAGTGSDRLFRLED